MENKKILENDEIDNVKRKLTYDEIVSSKSALDYQEKKNPIPVIRVIALSIIILAIIFGSLLLFHVL